MLEKTLAQLRRWLPFDSASIQLKVGDVVKVVACDGFDDSAKKEVMQLSFPLNPQFPNYEVVTEQQPLFIPDVLQSNYPHFWEQARVYHTGHVRTWIGIPLLLGKKVLGMLSVESGQPDAYTQEQQDLGVVFASRVVSAIAYAMSYKNVQSPNLFGNVQDSTQRYKLEFVLNRYDVPRN